jgi:hypothetical protein
MSNHNHLVAEALEILRGAGLTDAKVSNGGAHYKVKFTNAHGKRCLLVVSRSPSNRNAAQNNRSELRRLMRAHS